MSLHISRTRLFSIDVTANTCWLFLELCLDNGLTGWGEASLNGMESAVAAEANRLLPRLHGMDYSLSKTWFDQLPFATLPQAALSSALMQALSDIDARIEQQSIAEHLGGRRRDRIRLYANINRCSQDRSPDGMAACAHNAQLKGFDSIKIAPFDEVHTEMPRAAMRDAMTPGLERVAAVRESLGPSAQLMIDCHWRFDEQGANEMIRAVSNSSPYWLECPLPESKNHLDAICRVRRLANTLGIRLAGLETCIRRDGFLPYLNAGCYDVVMPDVKYAGGPLEMLRIAELLSDFKVAFSPHNPTGPVCHAHSLHICAALDESELLEHQFDETPLFDTLIGSTLPASKQGYITPDWVRLGLGVSLPAESIAKLTDTAAQNQIKDQRLAHRESSIQQESAR